MKALLLLISLVVTILSCSKSFYGTYNTNESKDKTAFFQIKLNADNTVEKTEIHTINNFAKGRFLLTDDKQVVCFFDSSTSKFPPDTLSFKLKGKKLYFVKNGVVNKNTYLKKQ